MTRTLKSPGGFTFAFPSPLTLVDVIPEPDEALARKIVELLARSKATEQAEEERDA